MRRETRWGVSLVGLLAGCGGEAGPTVPDHGPELSPAAVAVSHVRADPWPDPPDSLAGPAAGWPEVGTVVTWQAVLHNTGDRAAEGVEVQWRVDGVLVHVDTVRVEPGVGRADLPRAWRAEGEEISVWLSGSDVIRQADLVRVPTRGLSVGLHLEPSAWAWIDRQVQGGVAAWAAAELASWNQVLAGGAMDRLRLQELTISESYPRVIRTDLVWWFRNGADPRFAQRGSSPPVLTDQTIVLHELLHQRGLADLYAYEVLVGNPPSRMDILDPDGTPALGTERLPRPSRTPGRVWTWDESSRWLMGSDYRRPVRLSELSVWGLNRVAGRRTPRWRDDATGNHRNGLNWSNDYLLVMPDSVAIEVLGPGDGPLDGALVEVFPDVGALAYDDQYDARPAWTGTTDENGIAALPGPVIRPTPALGMESIAATAIVRVRSGDRWDYVFLPGALVSSAVARGEAEVVRVTVRAHPR